MAKPPKFWLIAKAATSLICHWTNGRQQKLPKALQPPQAVLLPHLLLAQEHGGQVPLNPTAPKKDLRPADAWFRVLVEGESAAPADAVREVRVHFEGTRQSLAQGWLDSALSVLIQQSGL